MQKIQLLAVLTLITVVSGKFTILHLTDVHGWIKGHDHDPNLNADFGDLVDLIKHMHENAQKAGDELFLFDTGDIIEGTGLSDATDVHGQYIFPVVQSVNYDGLTIGNHDIGRGESIDLMKKQFLPALGDRYVTSNSLDASNLKSIGSFFRVFDTALGHRVLVLGYLFNFMQNAQNTVVINVTDSLKQAYFAKAMSTPNVDLIVSLNHIDPQDQFDLLQAQYKAVRPFYPTTPYILLSGHRHIKYFKKFTGDDNAMTMESGRYFETIGKIEFSLGTGGVITNLQQSWFNTSRNLFYQMTGLNAQSFPTVDGNKVRTMIQQAWDTLGLGQVFGCAPNDFVPSGAYSPPKSLYYWYINQVFPSYFEEQHVNQPYVLQNMASLRATIYKGPVNKNDIFSVYPFNDDIVYFSGMKGNVLQALITNMNKTKSGFLTRQPQDFCGHPSQLTDAGVGYWGSDIPITADTTYDTITSPYDAVQFVKALANLFPGQTFTYSVYPGKGGPLKPSGLIQNYISLSFQQPPCTA